MCVDGEACPVHVWTSEDIPVELIFYSRLSVGYHDVWQVPSPIEPFHGPVTPVTKWNKNENRRNYRSLPHIAQERVLFKEELCELSKFMLGGGVQRIRAIGRDSTVQSGVLTVNS